MKKNEYEDGKPNSGICYTSLCLYVIHVMFKSTADAANYEKENWYL